MKKKDRYRTIILSDVHLGTPNCKVREVIHFLKRTRSERLILNGDIIDCWQLKKGSRWTKDHPKFVRLILKKMEKRDTEIIYLRGNHDDVLARFLPPLARNLPAGRGLRPGRTSTAATSCSTATSLTRSSRTWSSSPTSAISATSSSCRSTGFYNHYRTWRGKEYFSLSKAIKAKVKSAVSFISRFEEKIAALARSRDCRGVIVGHIHYSG